MKPEIKTKWLAALRSGDYLNGVGQMIKREPDDTISYCCLGVLSVVAKEEISKRDYLGAAYFTPADAIALGLTRADGRGEWHSGPLSKLNDGAFDFDKAIDYIKERL